MANAGYSDSMYAITVQDYESPIPNGSGFRYSQSGYTRQSTGGCGFWNADADYANATLLPTIDNSVLNAAAQASGVDFQCFGPPATRDWLRLVAHELTHVAQIELAQGEGRAEQWLAEGMAEWAAFSVLERLGLDALAERRAAALQHVREQAALREARLDLDTLGTPRGFTVRHQREGSLATYQLAFLMTDYLIRRHGFERLVEYYRGFAGGRGRREGFRLAFDQTLEEFETEIVAHLGQVLR